MKKTKVIVRRRRKDLDEDRKKKRDSNVNTMSDLKTKKQTPSTLKAGSTVKGHKREPYFFQIGFDFGTAFSKCICRDINTDESWVYVSPKFSGHDLACLCPSLVKLKGDSFYCSNHADIHYPADGLFHLKWALKEVASNNRDAQVLDFFKDASDSKECSLLTIFIELCVIYYLAGVLGEIRKSIRKRFNDFGNNPSDYMAVNLGVPVAFAEMSCVREMFHGALCDAWGLADNLAGHPKIKIEELKKLCIEKQYRLKENIQEACFLVPEVSANLQGFVKSRISMPGMYFFSDIGAATVDQCIFTFTRKKHEESLNYLHADVLPLGSSQIEYLAASQNNGSDSVKWSELEKWRECKERGDGNPALITARRKIFEHLSKSTLKNLSVSRRKLYCHDQLEETRLIFGGGGHCDNPYEEAVLSPFLNPTIFTKTINPNIIGIPKPADLSLNSQHESWLPRLSVAYGLSFNRFDLADNLFPHQINNPKEEEVWQPIAPKHSAPTKDEC